ATTGRTRRTVAPSTTASTSPQQNEDGEQARPSQLPPRKSSTDGAEDREPRNQRHASGHSDESLDPPMPLRRETIGAAPRPAVVGSVSLAQTVSPAEVQDKLGKMVGQMIVMGFEGTAPDQEWPKRIIAEIGAGQIGGVWFTNRNLRS